MAVHIGHIGFGGQLDSALLRHSVQLGQRLGPDVGIKVVQPGFQVSELLVDLFHLRGYGLCAVRDHVIMLPNALLGNLPANSDASSLEQSEH